MLQIFCQKIKGCKQPCQNNYHALCRKVKYRMGNEFGQEYTLDRNGVHFPELENCSVESRNHKQEGKVGHVHKNSGLDVRNSIFQSSSIFYLNSVIVHTQFIEYALCSTGCQIGARNSNPPDLQKGGSFKFFCLLTMQIAAKSD